MDSRRGADFLISRVTWEEGQALGDKAASGPPSSCPKLQGWVSLTPRKVRAQGAVSSGPENREEGLVPGRKAPSEP